MDRQNLTLLTDLYELTMMQGYFKNKEENNTVIFDAFFRTNPFGGGYSIMCGTEQLVKYIKELHFSKEDVDYLRSLGIFDEDFLNYLENFKFTGSIYSIPEGSLMFPREPMVEGGAYLLCGPRRRNHGVRSSPCPGSRRGNLRRSRGSHCRLRGNIQCPVRTAL